MLGVLEGPANVQLLDSVQVSGLLGMLDVGTVAVMNAANVASAGMFSRMLAPAIPRRVLEEGVRLRGQSQDAETR